MATHKISYDHGTSEFPLLYTTIGALFEHVAEQYPDSECLVSIYQNERFTYRRFNEMASQLAKGLIRQGIKRGDRVGIWAVNCWEWIAVQIATAKIGAILVNINPAYRTHELKYALNQSEASTLVLMDSYKSSKYREMLLELAPELDRCEPGRLESEALPHLKNVILLERAAPGMFGFADVLKSGADEDDGALRKIMSELEADDPINIQYTSGTTGFPKGVTLSHFNILNNAHHVAHLINLTHHDRLCIPVPFYHCFGMVLSSLACASQGAAMIVPTPTFDPEAVMKAVTAEKCTALHGVPTMFVAVLNHPSFSKYDFSTLRTGVMAGAPCPIELLKELNAKMNLHEIVIGYGQTEVSPIATLTRPEDPMEKRVGTVGRVLPMQEIKIIDPSTGRTVPRGMPGEICFRGYHLMTGYYNNDQATAETIDSSRWLHSGDIGVMDDEGYVKITGRIKEMVIRGGENLYPREIEEFLHTHPEIQDVYVIGVPDAKYGEELMAWVMPRNGFALTEVQLRDYCKGKITHFKVPRYWKFVRSSAEFPMTVTGKVQKFKMREQAIDELSLQAAAQIKTA